MGIKSLRSLSYVTTLGCDPEIFITRIAGTVRKRVAAVGSERIVPEPQVTDDMPPRVTRDGVQVELHVPGNTACREALAGQVSRAMSTLSALVTKARATRRDPSIAISFQPLVTLTRGDISRLSPEARELNCKPSRNAYGREQVWRDGSIYPIRTASGHLHLGNSLFTKNMIDPDEGVKVLDLLVGIPCVLVDQDPAQKIRRETYGRAGEYRLPKHGVEYRVPSNFWLQDYKMLSMVFGLAKLAMAVCEGFVPNNANKWAVDQLLSKVDFAKVEQAINENNVDMALQIYKESIRPFADRITTYQGFTSTSMDDFEYFVDTISESGLRHWFKLGAKAMLARWWNISWVGWERFLSEQVAPKRRAAGFTGIILDPAKAMQPAAVQPVVRRRSRAVAEAEQLRAVA